MPTTDTPTTAPRKEQKARSAEYYLTQLFMTGASIMGCAIMTVIFLTLMQRSQPDPDTRNWLIYFIKLYCFIGLLSLLLFIVRAIQYGIRQYFEEQQLTKEAAKP